MIFLTTTDTSLADAQEHAPEDSAAPLARSTRLQEQGVVVRAGAFLERPDELLSTRVVCTARAAAADFIQGDPFVRNGQVSAWHSRAWANMFA